MSAIINITNEDIAYSESILLNDGETFDDERIAFIKNLDTLDLQAVPGSGKTTVLLAKLLIVERYLPLTKNRGVLVLSHTNVAIDEITERIGKYCPKLFSYPNFVGTIQSFVDQFLAVPYYLHKYKTKPYRIDNDIYIEKVEKQLRFNLLDYTYQLGSKAKYYLKTNKLEYSYRLKYDNEELKVLNGINGSELNIAKPRSRGANWVDFSTNEKSIIKNWLIDFKLKIFELGVLNYDDAYFFAESYLSRFPRTKEIVQERFKFVFVDEMQDMDKHQYELLEEIFFDEGNSKSIYQRVGDKNQAIFNGRVSLDEIWSDRDTILKLKGSHRLTQVNAEVVNCLILERDEDYEVIGLNSGTIKPHVLVYTDDSIGEVIPSYSKIVNEHINSGVIKDKEDNNYNVIGWIKKHPEENKTSIKDYCNEFEVSRSVQRIDYLNLDTYLKLCDKSKGTLEPYRKNILNALIKTLRYEDVTNLITSRPYTKKNLMSYLKENFFDEYELLKLNLYNWSITLIKGGFENVYQEVKNYITDFLLIFEKHIINSSDFVNNPSDEIVIEVDSNNQSRNTVNHHGFDINIGTIHSAKGQTHTCTLYLETFHKIGGGGNYEWQRLSNQLKHTPFVCISSTTKIVKQTLKMAYVGLSRPTDLLCIAIHQDRFNANLSDIDTEKWEVLNVNLPKIV